MIINVSDFARLKGISRARVHQLIQAGRLKAYREGNLWKITSMKVLPGKANGRPKKV